MFRFRSKFPLILSLLLCSFISVMAQAKSAGEEAYKEIMDSGSAYPDQRVQDYVNRIGQELVRNSSKPKQKFTFTVIDSENINAFAMPGGFVFVNRGLMLFLDSEAELAGVIGHEIGHITENHSGRQQAAAVGSQIASQLAYIITGSADFADGTSMAGSAMVSGYGRDHELEADAAGAAFMHRSGYDPYSLLDVIGVLKDQEQYNRAKAKQSGKKPQTYHGLFSTHPRNDQRLHQVIQTAAELDPVPPVALDNAEFRSIINGMTYGKRAHIEEREEDRYYHNKLKFTFVEPANWNVKAGSRAIVANANDSSASVTVTIKRKDENATDRSFLGDQLEASQMIKSRELEQEGLKGYTAVAPASSSSNSRRLAVIYKGRIAYLFEGEVKDEAEFPIKDAYFMALIESFRSMKKSEAASEDAKKIEYVQAQPDLTWEALGKQAGVRDAENQLRLLNGQYPRGEPRAGDWIKIIR